MALPLSAFVMIMSSRSMKILSASHSSLVRWHCGCGTCGTVACGRFRNVSVLIGLFCFGF